MKRWHWTMAAGLAFLLVGAAGIASAHDHGSAYLGVRIDEGDGGAEVTRVVEDSPAEAAGLRKGDLIVEFDGRKIGGPRALTEAVRGHEPGERVTLEVLREGKRRSIDVELGERKENYSFSYSFSGDPMDEEWAAEMAERAEEWAQRYAEQAEKWAEQYGEHYEKLGEQWGEWAEKFAEEWAERGVAPDGGAYVFNFGRRPRLGVQLVDATSELREHLGGDADHGVLVGKVIEDSAAEAAGVEVGDLIVAVDGEPIGSSGDLVRELSRRAGETFEIEVVRNGRKRSLDVTLDEAETGVRGPRAFALPPLPSMPVLPDAAIAPLAAPALALPDAPVAPFVAPAPLVAPAPVVAPEIRRELREVRRRQREQVRELAREAREARREAVQRRIEERREVQREIRHRIRDARRIRLSDVV